MKLILLFIFFATKLTAQDSLIISGIEAPLPSFSKKFNIEDVQASTDKNDPSTIKINIKGEAKNVSFPIKLPFKAEATNPSNSKPLNQQEEPSAAVAIEDKDGGVYEVDDKGKTKKIGNKGSELPPTEYKEAARKMNVRLGRATTPKLMFKALASEPLAFDEWQENFKGKSIIEKEYQKIGENYYVPIKLIPAGMTGKVQVDLNGINKDSVIFKTPNGSVYTLQENNILSIAGAKNGDGIELYAQNKFDSTIIYGKLNIYGYEIKNLKVNLVPVNSTATIEKEKLENELNKIYYPYGVSVSLNVLNKIEEKSWDINNDGKLDVGETGILNFRTDEMKAVHRLNVNKNADEIYLYLMQEPSKADVEGDMPLGSQYGFLFGDPNARTLSHEIAHGYFQLKHSFDESIALQKSSTNNLMDYANGNTLYKYQWDLVHDKGLMIAKLWQSDSTGEAINKVSCKIVDGEIITKIYSKVLQKEIEYKFPEYYGTANYDIILNNENEIKQDFYKWWKKNEGSNLATCQINRDKYYLINSDFKQFWVYSKIVNLTNVPNFIEAEVDFHYFVGKDTKGKNKWNSFNPIGYDKNEILNAYRLLGESAPILEKFFGGTMAVLLSTLLIPSTTLILVTSQEYLKEKSIEAAVNLAGQILTLKNWEDAKTQIDWFDILFSYLPINTKFKGNKKLIIETLIKNTIAAGIDINGKYGIVIAGISKEDDGKNKGQIIKSLSTAGIEALTNSFLDLKVIKDCNVVIESKLKNSKFTKTQKAIRDIQYEYFKNEIQNYNK